jgi:hypothetical protein
MPLIIIRLACTNKTIKDGGIVTDTFQAISVNG